MGGGDTAHTFLMEGIIGVEGKHKLGGGENLGWGHRTTFRHPPDTERVERRQAHRRQAMETVCPRDTMSRDTMPLDIMPCWTMGPE